MDKEDILKAKEISIEIITMMQTKKNINPRNVIDGMIFALGAGFSSYCLMTEASKEEIDGQLNSIVDILKKIVELGTDKNEQ